MSPSVSHPRTQNKEHVGRWPEGSGSSCAPCSAVPLALGTSLALTCWAFPSRVLVRGEAAGPRRAARSDRFRGKFTIHLPEQSFQTLYSLRSDPSVV